MEEFLNCSTPGEWCRLINARSYNPLVAAIDYHDLMSYSNPKGVCFEFYNITLYVGENSCEVKYGRNMYNYHDVSLFFTAPGQIVSFSDHGKIYRPQEQCVSVLFHPDYIRNSFLAEKMASYKFFNYEVHDALWLADTDMEDVMRCYNIIDKELRANTESDRTDTIVCSALELLLNYCSRIYERQFEINHKNNNDVVSRFESLLKEYYTRNEIRSELPTVKYFADMLNLSPDYLSNLLRKETGKNAREHIQYTLLELAKDKLCRNDTTVSQVAYELGFEYPQYFSRLFKKKVGISPNDYRSGR